MGNVPLKEAITLAQQLGKLGVEALAAPQATPVAATNKDAEPPLPMHVKPIVHATTTAKPSNKRYYPRGVSLNHARSMVAR